MKANLFSLILGATLLAGCAAPDGSKPAADNLSATNPSGVVILYSRPEKPFVEITTVSTLKAQPDRAESWQRTLAKQAAAHGAEAVVVDMTTLNNRSMPMVTGTAIRYGQ